MSNYTVQTLSFLFLQAIKATTTKLTDAEYTASINLRKAAYRAGLQWGNPNLYTSLHTAIRDITVADDIDHDAIVGAVLIDLAIEDANAYVWQAAEDQAYLLRKAIEKGQKARDFQLAA